MKYLGGGGATASAGPASWAYEFRPTQAKALSAPTSQRTTRAKALNARHEFLLDAKARLAEIDQGSPQKDPVRPPGTAPSAARHKRKRRGGARNRGRGSQESQSPRSRGTCDMECAQPEAMSRVPVTWQPASRHTLQTPDHQGSAPDVARKLPQAQLQAHSRWGLSALAWPGLASAASVVPQRGPPGLGLSTDDVVRSRRRPDATLRLAASRFSSSSCPSVCVFLWRVSSMARGTSGATATAIVIFNMTVASAQRALYLLAALIARVPSPAGDE
ncbi:hypothetical protein EDB80DRAFT_680573 [Ilyonectria destructans]|nr:hypothetical protein EDB80DRAFT_680573 [Ilyonectria destructans]